MPAGPEGLGSSKYLLVAMLVLAFFILLPAVSLGLFYPCNKTILDNFFEVVDFNHDGGINKTEAYNFFNLLDTDGNGKLTLAEVTAKTALIAPKLVGDEAYIFSIIDVFKNGQITTFEIFLDFIFIDTNHNGVKSKDEWDRRHLSFY